jgi:hypothetical protein
MKRTKWLKRYRFFWDDNEEYPLDLSPQFLPSQLTKQEAKALYRFLKSIFEPEG